MNEEKKPVWFVTGCSTGFGREIVRHVLDQGYRVVATSRNLRDIENLGNGAANRICRLKLDVTHPDEITSAVEAAEEHFGHIDVLVNNAGVGYFGAIEESDQNDVRRMFEVNFWGLANMTRAVLPGMRRRRAGHIVNMSSIGGVRGGPAVGYYNATKFAVEGFSEALAAEVTALGLKVTLVEPSGFRTDWAGRSAREADTWIDDYASTAGARRLQLRSGSGSQPGDPARAASAILAAVEAPNPPLHLLLGNFALEVGRHRVDALAREFETWAAVSKVVDFPMK
ncbi:oxidoreductase [Acidithiobacillus thiooxidans]|uniref:Putative oxidoreductase YusZ n=1 Tax=Acidithiobacillus thiooxidans ATCC 19377 TaxID=637390 RepID=A0A543PZN2_ACITH|nr:oxidoreductase [Acidithiobacillus thiooxidans]MDX5935853.1 oxidoreductase [Acidithiobacillus thiooxidans]TQN49533.1 putative oxidoreductase YusZ [Acidithiobacillus thiooxidans ATCC 19377]